MPKTLLIFFCLIIFLANSACKLNYENTSADKKETETTKTSEDESDKTDTKDIELSSETENSEIAEKKDGSSDSDQSKKVINEPKNVRDYFMLLPAKYFTIECCEGDKTEYLKNYIGVEDIKNGYMDGGGDAAQSTFRMALFKRPDKTYIIALNVFGEAQDDYYFLDYSEGKWSDISSTVIPEFAKNKIYDIPREGTTMAVFEKKVLDSDGEIELTEKGNKLYDLIWKDGKFTIKK